MAEKPTGAIFEILSRLPAKSLARFRCVSKPWCACIDNDYFGTLHGERAAEELIPIMYDPNLSCITGFNIIKSEEGETTMEAKKGISLESELYKSYFTHRRNFAGGSCNWLLYLLPHYIPYVTSLIVIHPLRKEFYELPPIKRRLDGRYYLSEESHGLGFDVSTNTFKMMFVLSRTQFSKSGTVISKNLCTMVHVLGVDSSWREIPQVPPYPTSGHGIFAHGCLYWIVSHKSNFPKELICFDVRNEEFTLIHSPNRRCGYSVAYHQLVDLQGEVGYACFYSDEIIEMWVLKQKQWVKHCEFTKRTPPLHGHIKVLGRWNKNGDLLIMSSAGRNNLFVYSLKNRVLDEVNIVGQEYGSNAFMYMYPASSIFTIRSMNKTAHSIETDLKQLDERFQLLNCIP